MIRSFGDKDTESLYFTGKSRRYASILSVARRKLQVMNSTRRLDDLSEPAGNRLETLRGNRRGQHSIRIDDQFQICFVWRDGEPYEVQIVDFH